MRAERTELQVVDRELAAAALLHPLRRRIVEHLREPDSASGLARRLGLPRQKLNYHLRELERAELLELVEERRRGNCTERVLRATAAAYLIGPRTLGRLAADPERIRDRFSSAYLMAVAARVIRDLADLRGRALDAGKRLATLTLQSEVRFASATDRAAFTDELTREVARLAAKYHHADAPDGRTFRFVVGGYPEPDSGKETQN
ncbi:MAG TPA: helix-turn-helix domain-containing protein [Candidatus Polarisedimenticolaceae bacterium]|nr:helix-turn-helix domain-containing protein [Candidatus Polarisedimenticolaceae bacterium]